MNFLMVVNFSLQVKSVHFSVSRNSGNPHLWSWSSLESVKDSANSLVEFVHIHSIFHSWILGLRKLVAWLWFKESASSVQSIILFGPNLLSANLSFGWGYLFPSHTHTVRGTLLSCLQYMDRFYGTGQIKKRFYGLSLVGVFKWGVLECRSLLASPRCMRQGFDVVWVWLGLFVIAIISRALMKLVVTIKIFLIIQKTIS